MTRYKIEFDSNICIGSLNCLAVAGEVFAEDNRKYTILKNATLNEKTGKMELTIGEDMVEKARRAEDNCPSLAITVSEA
jgi:ferredoxin